MKFTCSEYKNNVYYYFLHIKIYFLRTISIMHSEEIRFMKFMLLKRVFEMHIHVFIKREEKIFFFQIRKKLKTKSLCV